MKQSNVLNVLAGSRGIGKTHWMEQMLAEYRGTLARVRTCTTRPWREAADDHSYVFLTDADFQTRVDSGWFLEHDDDYKGFRYGSSLIEIKPVLEVANGILALTTPGVQAVWERRFEIPVNVVAFLPASREMARRNIERRAIDPPETYDDLAKEAMAWRPPEGVDCREVILTGTDDQDRAAVLAAFELS
jgi:guanylate kinase